MIQAKAMMTDAESKVEKNKIEMMKNQAEAQSKMREQQLTLREQSLKGEIEKMKAELALIKNSTDSETKVASLELQMEKQDTEQQINKLEVALGAVQDERDREIALYKIQMDSLVRLMQQYGMSVDPEMLEGRRAEITEQSEAEKVAPEQIREIRDWMGELIAQNQVLAENIESIKTRPVKRRRQLVKRDANGLILSVEDDMSDG